ncbi:DNA gyrase inhibitor YacG [Motiliproteus sp. SC1-56]|uniref:DNA gyrase inhibitor YacG n=1 Tax=Motiliproteus sp. SC1-56 TaxID=2799565 RepID=UPI001A8CF79C|nr:DNA gyrase inhibitor YacG [Motiliproteus sp. SC1-56]
MSQSAKRIPCPQCKKPSEWSSRNPWRPFCSERCKLIDLGAWANEEYQIEGQRHPDFSDPDSAGEEDGPLH